MGAGLQELQRKSPQIAQSLPKPWFQFHIGTWREALRNHPDHPFVDGLLNDVENGVAIGYDGLQICYSNHLSATTISHSVINEILRELNMRRRAGPFVKPPFPHFVGSQRTHEMREGRFDKRSGMCNSLIIVPSQIKRSLNFIYLCLRGFLPRGSLPIQPPLIRSRYYFFSLCGMRQWLTYLKNVSNEQILK